MIPQARGLEDPKRGKDVRGVARALVTDARYLAHLYKRVLRGQAPQIASYFWKAGATKQKATVLRAGRSFFTCPLMRANFPNGQICESCICGEKQRRVDPARGPQQNVATTTIATPRHGIRFIRALLQDSAYLMATLRRLRAGALPSNLELYLWQLAYGNLDEMEAALVKRGGVHIKFMRELRDPLKRKAEASESDATHGHGHGLEPEQSQPVPEADDGLGQGDDRGVLFDPCKACEATGRDVRSYGDERCPACAGKGFLAIPL